MPTVTKTFEFDTVNGANPVLTNAWHFYFDPVLSDPGARDGCNVVVTSFAVTGTRRHYVGVGAGGSGGSDSDIYLYFDVYTGSANATYPDAWDDIGRGTFSVALEVEHDDALNGGRVRFEQAGFDIKQPGLYLPFLTNFINGNGVPQGGTPPQLNGHLATFSLATGEFTPGVRAPVASSGEGTLARVDWDWGDGTTESTSAFAETAWFGASAAWYASDAQVSHTFPVDEQNDGSGQVIRARAVNSFGCKSVESSIALAPEAALDVSFDPDTGGYIADARESFGRTGKLTGRTVADTSVTPPQLPVPSDPGGFRLSIKTTLDVSEHFTSENGAHNWVLDYTERVIRPALDLDERGRVWRFDLPTPGNYALMLAVRDNANATATNQLIEGRNAGAVTYSKSARRVLRIEHSPFSVAVLPGGTELLASEAVEFATGNVGVFAPAPRITFQQKVKRWYSPSPGFFESLRTRLNNGEWTQAQYDSYVAFYQNFFAQRLATRPWDFYPDQPFVAAPRAPVQNASAPSLVFDASALTLCAKRFEPEARGTWLWRSSDEGRTWTELSMLWTPEYYHASIVPLAGNGIATVAMKRASAPNAQNGQPTFYLELWFRRTLDPTRPEALSAPVKITSTARTDVVLPGVSELEAALVYPVLVNEALIGSTSRLLAWTNSGLSDYAFPLSSRLFESLDCGATWRTI